MVFNNDPVQSNAEYKGTIPITPNPIIRSHVRKFSRGKPRESFTLIFGNHLGVKINSISCSKSAIA